MSAPTNLGGPRESVTVTCSSCGVETSVPFTPTPGRPVYCRECFARVGGAAGGASRGRSGGPARGSAPRDERPPPTPRKRMMAQGRKPHFVYDAMELLGKGEMPEGDRRPFVESLFQRGVRQSTQAAREWLAEKCAEGAVTKQECAALEGLVEQYSFWR